MEIVQQKLDDILGNLRPVTVEWQDETSQRVIKLLRGLHVKKAYTAEDVKELLDGHFDDAMLICRLFLALSKDQFQATLQAVREDRGIGVKSYRADRDGFIADLLTTGLLDSMAVEANRKPHWSEVLVERLRSGRGSAIAGQKRGRGLEDFAEAGNRSRPGVAGT